MTNHSRSFFGLTVLKNSHPDIRRLKKQYGNHLLHGNKVWKSSLVLMDYLMEYPPEKGCNILEVGCGWGLASIFCAKQFGAQVVALDADDQVLPFLEHHALLNAVEVDTVAMNIEAISAEQLANFDMVIASDICFWDELVPTVQTLITRCQEAAVPRVVIADPGRPSFRNLAEHCQLNYACLYSDWVVPAPHNAWGLLLEINAEE